jgi:antitoxin ParD1/3/4
MDLTLSISLPSSLKKWVEEHVARKGYDNTDAFLIDILRREQEQDARDRVDALLVQAIDSGESTPMTAGDWERIRTAGRRRFQARRKKPCL